MSVTWIRNQYLKLYIKAFIWMNPSHIV